MFIKISGPSTYVNKFVKLKSDLSNQDKIEKELAEISVLYPTDLQKKAASVTFDGSTKKVFDFVKQLQDAVDAIKNKEVKENYNSFMFGGLDYLGADPEIAQEQLEKDLASLERQIVERENNLIDIDTYIMQLVTGKEGAQLNISHSNAKFVKIAEDDMVKEADEVIEDYYNDLYQDSEGSPDFGTALEHPEETKNELTTKIHHHRFKKK